MKELNLFLNTKRSINTRKSYESHLNELFDYKSIKNIEDFKKLTADDYYEWKNYLLDKGVSENSIRPKLSAISKFYEFLMDREEFNVNLNIIKKSKIYDTTKKIVNPSHTTWLNDKEMELFFKTCKTKRELAICSVLFNTGLRVSELINLQLDKFIRFVDGNNEEVSSIIIVRKGGKMQNIRFNSAVTKYVVDYLEVRKPTKCKNIFVSNTGNPMSTQSIDRTLNKIASKAGINRRISAHSLRRSAATDMYNKGFTLEEVQDVLGHSSPETTQIYLKGMQDRAQNVFKNYVAVI